MMLADHTKTSTELKSMISATLKEALPTALDDASQKKITTLRDAKPEDFASEYDSMQVAPIRMRYHSSSAMRTAATILAQGLGCQTLPALKHHLEMAQALNKNRK